RKDRSALSNCRSFRGSCATTASITDLPGLVLVGTGPPGGDAGRRARPRHPRGRRLLRPSNRIGNGECRDAPRAAAPVGVPPDPASPDAPATPSGGATPLAAAGFRAVSDFLLNE